MFNSLIYVKTVLKWILATYIPLCNHLLTEHCFDNVRFIPFLELKDMQNLAFVHYN